MTSEQAPAPPAPPGWLEISVTYTGWGRAEFTDPPGIVEGPAVVKVDRRGRQMVTIDVKNPPAQWWSFYLKGEVAAANFRRHGFCNPCKSIMVKTAEGLFTATERIFYAGGGTPTRPHRIQLRPLRSQYEVSGATEPAYWVLPLSNFILADWPWSGPDLTKHPLPIYVPQNNKAEDGVAPDCLTVVNKHPVAFEISGQTGFIERLPDYDKLVLRLSKGRTANTVNAVMVSPAHVSSVAFSDYEGLFPLDVVALLSLATGVRVGAPWIEFRSRIGQIVRRAHIPFGAPAYQQGHAALSDMTPGALGNLLTSAFRSPELGKSHLRVVMHQVIGASFHDQSLDSTFVDLARAFETLCSYHKLGAEDLSVYLNPSQQQAVRGTLVAAADEVKTLAKSEPDATRAGALDRIADKVLNAALKEKHFGLAVVELGAGPQ